MCSTKTFVADMLRGRPNKSRRASIRRSSGGRAAMHRPFTSSPLPSGMCLGCAWLLLASLMNGVLSFTVSANSQEITPIPESDQSMSSRSATPASSAGSVYLEGLYDLCKPYFDKRDGWTIVQCRKLAAAVRELSDYVKKYCKRSFTVKGSQYEVSAV